jgi:hypothetical protein
MATSTDTLSTPPAPNRVYYSLGRMLGVDDFQADQDYHRGRLACALLQLFGTGTVSGLQVKASAVWQPGVAYPQWAFVMDPSGNIQVNTGSIGTSGSTPPKFAAAGSSVAENGIQWTNEGTILATGWQANTAFKYPSVIVDSNGNLQILAVTAGLTSGAKQPSWTTTNGGLTADGATASAWRCLGPLEIVVTPGIAIDRAGRIIQAPRTVCIRFQTWLGNCSAPDLNSALHGGNLLVDVFATYVGCTRGVTPCFATQDDYDATDAFSANRMLDSFAMQLVLRNDASPALPADPWLATGLVPAAAGGAAPVVAKPPVTPPPVVTPIVASPPPALGVPVVAAAGTPQALKQNLLDAISGPGAVAPWGTAPGAEYPLAFDATSVFLARISIPATAGAGGQPPTYSLGSMTIDNLSRLFLFPAALAARWTGLSSGS